MLIPIGFFGKSGLFAPKSGLTTRTNYSGTYFSAGTTAKYIFLAAAAGNFYISTNGTTWTTSTPPSNSNGGYGVASNGTVAVYADGQTAYSTTNGTTWTNRGFIGGEQKRIIWDGSRFLSPSQQQATAPLFYSTDGTAWSSSAGNIFSGAPGLNIGFDGTSRYIFTRTGSSTAARTCTTNPTVLGNWSSITLPSAGVWAGIAYGAGTWVLTRAGSNVYATSTNGTTWTSRTLPSLFSETTSDQGQIIFANGKFWYYYTDNVYYSTDGITWVAESVTGGSLDNLATWIYDGTWLRGFGSDSTAASATTYIEGVI